MPFFFETIMEAIKNGTVPPFERDSVMCLRKFEEVINKAMADKDQTIAALRAEVAEWKRVASEQAKLHDESASKLALYERAIEQLGKPTWFTQNCKKNRKWGAACCSECPFREMIEAQEAIRALEGE